MQAGRPETTPAERLETAARPPFPHATLEGPDGRLLVVDTGPPPAGAAGGTVLLLHGGHGGWFHWRANIAALARQARVIVPDLPGFGLSDAPREFSLDAVVAGVDWLFEALTLQGVTLVGYSFGSLVATSLAARRADRVARLLLVNPPGWGRRSPETARRYDEAASIARAGTLREGVAYTLRHLMLCDTSLIDAACLDASEAAVRNNRFVSRSISLAADLPALLAAVHCRLHVCFGAEDPSHKFELDARLARLAALRGAGCTTVLAGARHWAQQDRADAFNQLLAAYLRDEPLPAAIDLEANVRA